MEEKIKLINQVVSSYFETNKDVKEIPAKDLMPEFIKKGIFNADPKKGLNIRKVL